jgi:hypothetical protein
MSWRDQKIFTIVALAAALAINTFPVRTEGSAEARYAGAAKVAQASTSDASHRAER